jgi:hypothetical protein
LGFGHGIFIGIIPLWFLGLQDSIFLLSCQGGTFTNHGRGIIP